MCGIYFVTISMIYFLINNFDSTLYFFLNESIPLEKSNYTAKIMPIISKLKLNKYFEINLPLSLC